MIWVMNNRPVDGRSSEIQPRTIGINTTTIIITTQNTTIQKFTATEISNLIRLSP
jgi:hypothetical protein